MVVLGACTRRFSQFSPGGSGWAEPPILSVWYVSCSTTPSVRGYSKPHENNPILAVNLSGRKVTQSEIKKIKSWSATWWLIQVHQQQVPNQATCFIIEHTRRSHLHLQFPFTSNAHLNQVLQDGCHQKPTSTWCPLNLLA